MDEWRFFATFKEASNDCVVTLSVDLGFGIRADIPFRIIAIKQMPEIGEQITDMLTSAEAIVVQSHKFEDGKYLGDISFCVEGSWYNLIQTLLRQGAATTQG